MISTFQQVLQAPPPQDVACMCDAGWGDVGCTKQLQQLDDGQLVGNPMLAAGAWQYYLVNLPQGFSTLLVELRRIRGDPILFLKGIDEGFEASCNMHARKASQCKSIAVAKG